MKTLFLAAVAAAALPAVARADAADTAIAPAAVFSSGIPAQLTAEQRTAYRAVLAAVREGDTWTGAVSMASPITGEFPTR